jgi:hypothetical protein
MHNRQMNKWVADCFDLKFDSGFDFDSDWNSGFDFDSGSDFGLALCLFSLKDFSLYSINQIVHWPHSAKG